MTIIQKQALKDMLHLMVDKEEIPVLKELVSKLPSVYASILNGILDMGAPAIVKAQDDLIEKI